MLIKTLFSALLLIPGVASASNCRETLSEYASGFAAPSPGSDSEKVLLVEQALELTDGLDPVKERVQSTDLKSQIHSLHRLAYIETHIKTMSAPLQMTTVSSQDIGELLEFITGLVTNDSSDHLAPYFEELKDIASTMAESQRGRAAARALQLKLAAMTKIPSLYSHRTSILNGLIVQLTRSPNDMTSADLKVVRETLVEFLAIEPLMRPSSVRLTYLIQQIVQLTQQINLSPIAREYLVLLIDLLPSHLDLYSAPLDEGTRNRVGRATVAVLMTVRAYHTLLTAQQIARLQFLALESGMVPEGPDSDEESPLPPPRPN